MELKSLLGEGIKSIYSASIFENNQELILDDTLVLKTLNGKLLQVLIHYKIKVIEIVDFSKIEVIGEYTQRNLKYKLLKEFDIPAAIVSIINYYHGKHYHFGSDFLDINLQVIFSVCFGFDELKLLDKPELDKAIERYDFVVKKIISL